ncbi:nuclear receptor-like protein [Leptotrombidium deliense]|uniref:Nuclear receptor-like protein n=1 Tax=Leptotrombidium deliense TaxID=299467 RepID=A0A443SU68_9ACAR|nr:nuclear receptor-like protein [Leptotrombidium deliense]
MVCFYVSDSMKEARVHYKLKHMDDETNEKNCLPRTMFNNVNNLNGLSGIQNDIVLPLTNNFDNNIEHEDHFSPENDEMENMDRFSPLVTMSEGILRSSLSLLNKHFRSGFEPVNGNVSGGKSGYVNCAVCGVTRFYSCVQRRYGQFTCVTCYRYFRTFLLKPKRFSCPNLGSCQLNVRTRCRACWINACISVFSVDLRRQEVINAFRPVRKITSSSPNPKTEPEPESETGTENDSFPTIAEDSYENDEMQESEMSPITLSFSNGDDLPSMLERGDVTIDGKTLKLSNQVKLTPGKKIWSCGKCATCMAEDCGKCIYCLDRPKFGGPFIKKQRCIKRRCLMKIKNKQNGFSFNG